MATKAKAKSKAKSAPSRSTSTKRRSTSTSKRRVSSSSRSRGHAALAKTAKRMGQMAVEQSVPADALSLLEQDHREVEAFFDQFEQAEENSEKSELARKICLALTVHAEIEEKIFYPRARKATGEDDLLNEAEVEHASAKQLIAEIEEMTPRDKLFDAKVKVLGEYVKHHVQEEENELFPKVRESELDLYDIGAKLAEQKVALLTEFAGEK